MRTADALVRATDAIGHGNLEKLDEILEAMPADGAANLPLRSAMDRSRAVMWRARSGGDLANLLDLLPAPDPHVWAVLREGLADLAEDLLRLPEPAVPHAAVVMLLVSYLNEEAQAGSE